MTKDGPTAKPPAAPAPTHIAIIMDGNGRWAKKRLLPRVAGHREGAKAVDRVVTYCRRIGVKALTLYSFSSENWRRPRDEVSALMKMLKQYIDKELARMLEKGIRFNVIGDIQTLPPQTRKAVEMAIEKTSAMTGMTLTLALSYGSRDEITRAVREIARKSRDGELSPDDIDETLVSSSLDTRDLPDPDLLIRSGGDIRLSNFLMWQSAYTELYFTETLWPDFKEKDIQGAIEEFHKRERRFGMTGEQAAAKRNRDK